MAIAIGVSRQSRDRLHNCFARAVTDVRFLLRSLVLSLVITNVAIAAPALPIRSGLYIFQHRYAEQPTMPSITLLAKINGHHIVLINQSQSDVFPMGVIVDGALAWHAQSKQWIVIQTKSDRSAKDVGGCSEGPDVIDLINKIYWTC